MNYTSFLFSNLLREYNKDYSNLPYDEMFTTHNSLLEKYENSEFNIDDKSEYTCMTEFLDSLNNLYFNVLVNPFKKTALINVTINDVTHDVRLVFDQLDEWGSFKIYDKSFDIHFHYDEEFSLSIYGTHKEGIGTGFSYKTNLKIQL